jgi:hypothetical protein
MNMCEQGQEDDDTGVDAPVENQATDQEDSIIDETLNLSTVLDRTWSKSKSPRSTLSQQLLSPLIPMTSSLVHHVVRRLNVGQAYHTQVVWKCTALDTGTDDCILCNRGFHGVVIINSLWVGLHPKKDRSRDLKDAVIPIINMTGISGPFVSPSDLGMAHFQLRCLHYWTNGLAHCTRSTP